MTRPPSLIPLTTVALLWWSGAALAEDGATEIFDERADKPGVRDTELRLTGAQLAARGAVDLATALALLPDVAVRDDGRGGTRVELRGQRDAVNVFVDGVLVPDPYDGSFDLSAVPVTDIVQIRVAKLPQSPIDGLGGAGGVIEVHTRDALGPQLVIARLTTDSLPSVGATGTARVAIARGLALRLSASGLGGARELAPRDDARLDEQRRAATGALRLEYRAGDLHIAVDGAVDDRHRVAPRNAVAPGLILMIDGETTARVSARVDAKLGALQLQGQLWSQYLSRRARWFADPELTMQRRLETSKAVRSGAMVLATRPFLRDFRWTASTSLDFTKAVIADLEIPARRSHATLVETAAGAQYARGPVRAELAAGLVIPFLRSSSLWPEGKAAVRYLPLDDLELRGTVAYKGRAPTLRELFDSRIGNQALDPERTTHGELRAIGQVTAAVHGELAAFYRRTTDTLHRSVLTANFNQLVNKGEVKVWGVDAQVRVTPGRGIEAGAGYELLSPASDQPNDDALDLLPNHRLDGWVQVQPARWISALARATYVGRSIDPPERIGRYVLVEASAAAQLAPAYAAVLRVDDLLNARPELGVGYRGPGRVISLVIQGTWE